MRTGVAVLARLDSADDDAQTIVAVRQDNLLGTAFHPEVTGDPRFHAYFLGIAREHQLARSVHAVTV